VALNNAGFALLQHGSAQDAVDPLTRSVRAFRQQGSTGVIDYAYALFNLGNALRLTGRPADAIPFLRERLRISDFRRDDVVRELAIARREAGVAPAPSRGNGHGANKGDGGDGHGGPGQD
jgi:serine/threonine-protein kinase